MLWTSEQLTGATGGTCSAPFVGNAISIDTRTLKPGDIYLALKGEKLDGHDYVTAAFDAGAAGAIVRNDFSSGAGPVLRVPDTFHALQDIGRAGRARSRARIIGVTGSAGKTGTKEMLAQAFSAFGPTHASKKSYNNHWGVPLSLANLPPDAAFGVFEMGMNHTGEIADLTRQVRPSIVIITTIEPVHIENFKNIEGIADAKAEIFDGVDKGGHAILNIDNPHFARLKRHAEAKGLIIIPFGEDDEAQARLIDCTLHPRESGITASVFGETVRTTLHIPGKHIVMNALAVLAAVKAAGCALAPAARALENAETVEGRGNRITVRVPGGAITIVDESYNANPAAMRAALEVFAMAEPDVNGRRIAVLGDMLELGRDGPKMHAELANPLLKAKTDLVFCCGPLMDALFNVLPPDWRGAHAKNSQELAPLVAAAVRPGDIILVKGSLGSKMSYVVQALQSLQENAGEKRNAV